MPQTGRTLEQTPQASGGEGSLHPADRQRRSAEAMGENEAWLRDHEARLLREHPEWKDKWVAVASCTPAKIVAAAARRIDAIEEGVKSPELIEFANREGMHPGSLLTAVLLGADAFED